MCASVRCRAKGRPDGGLLTDLESCHVRFVDGLCDLACCNYAEYEIGMSHRCDLSGWSDVHQSSLQIIGEL